MQKDNVVSKPEWRAGREDRGMGHYSYAVLEGDRLVAKGEREDVERIVRDHNEALSTLSNNENQNSLGAGSESAARNEHASPMLNVEPQLGEWLTNSNDHRGKDAKREIGFSNPNVYWEHIEWLKDKLIGRPKATVAYTVEQLEAMGMIGVYAQPEASEETNEHTN